MVVPNKKKTPSRESVHHGINISCVSRAVNYCGSKDHCATILTLLRPLYNTLLRIPFRFAIRRISRDTHILINSENLTSQQPTSLSSPDLRLRPGGYAPEVTLTSGSTLYLRQSNVHFVGPGPSKRIVLRGAILVKVETHPAAIEMSSGR